MRTKFLLAVLITSTLLTFVHPSHSRSDFPGPPPLPPAPPLLPPLPPAPPGVNVSVSGYLPAPPGVHIYVDGGQPYYIERGRHVYLERKRTKKYYKTKHHHDHGREDHGHKVGHHKH